MPSYSVGDFVRVTGPYHYGPVIGRVQRVYDTGTVLVAWLDPHGNSHNRVYTPEECEIVYAEKTAKKVVKKG